MELLRGCYSDGVEHMHVDEYADGSISGLKIGERKSVIFSIEDVTALHALLGRFLEKHADGIPWKEVSLSTGVAKSGEFAKHSGGAK